jgi:glycosyltransferase involved in cell wall biosynthesis/mannose-6-phosphate isomerase-like protein (cupin superfamily)
MKIAILSSIAWRTPPRHYGPWEKVTSLLTEGLVERGFEVTLFATKDSLTKGRLDAVVERGYEEDKSIDAKVAEYLHISNLMEKADDFDIIHNNFDFPALSYCELIRTPIVTTIHGFSSKRILPVYKKYNGKTFYVAISNADRDPELDYIATIYHGIDLSEYTFGERPGEYLLFFGRIHNEKGTREAIEVAKRTGKRLVIAGIIQDDEYFQREVVPHIDGERIVYVGSVGFPEKADLLSSAYALLHLVNFEEPFGLSMVEALASGTPVIGNRRGAVPEILEDGKTGFIVNSLEEAVERVKRVKEIDRRACRASVEERFTRDRMVDEYVEVYKRVAEGGLGRAKRGLRPWGGFLVLEEGEGYKVKRIEVKKGRRLSYQRHRRRSEHWFVVEGKALCTIDGKEVILCKGESIDIPLGAKHRIEAIENLLFIEVQRGSYLGEDDVERLEDDFGRV